MVSPTHHMTKSDALTDHAKLSPEHASLDPAHPPHTTVPSPEPTLWLELLPLAVQHRIAEHVCHGIPSRDALAFASATVHTRDAVATALNYHLLEYSCPRIHGHTSAWVRLYANVRVLELWEHPNNFELLTAPGLTEIIVEDEPLQVAALARSKVSVERVEFYANYGTPPHVIVNMFKNISFTDLDFSDVHGHFFEHVDVPAFADACTAITSLCVTAPTSAQEPIKDLIGILPSLQSLELDIHDVQIDFEDQLPGHSDTPTVTHLGLYLNSIPWFETFALPEQLRSLWLASARGWGENEVLQFASAVIQLPRLTSLDVKFRGGAECFFPRVSSLERFRAHWDDPTYLPDGEALDYKPKKGVLSHVIEGMPLLSTLRLFGVRLDDEEVSKVIETVGERIENLTLSIERQDTHPMERLLVIIKALTKYTKNLEIFRLYDSNRDVNGNFLLFPSMKPIKMKRKRQILLYLDQLRRHAPNVVLNAVEIALLNQCPEEEENDEEVETALGRYFNLRRCCGGINESDDPDHMCILAELLETGCEGLAQDREAAIELYKRAALKDDPGDAILNLWRLTEDPKDTGLEPRPGGAFELVLELDETRVRKLPESAEIFLQGTDRTDAIPAAADKLLQLSINRGFTESYCYKLASLVGKGYDDVTPDSQRAFDLYKLAIDEHDDPAAMFSIAELLKSGFAERRPDPEAAREYLERGTRLEWAPCMNNLGLLKWEGYGNVAPDPAAAIDLFKRAISYGNTVAMSNLALMYIETGDGDPLQTQKAIELYERAISEGQNSHAMLMLGSLHENGCGDMVPNPSRAKELYIQAIEHGESSALVHLGDLVCDVHNDDVPGDPDEAMRLYQLAIDTGNKLARGLAFTAYGELMELGCGQVEANPVKAVEYYRRAVENESARAMCLLACMLEGGRPGVERDPDAACKLLELGVEAGSADAMLNLGDMLMKGEWHGVKQDYTRAEELFTKALNAGSIDGYYYLAHMQEFGLGYGAANPQKAIELYEKGMDAGDRDCIVSLGDLYEHGCGELRPDPLRAITFYERAINEGYSRGGCYLGFLREEGFLDEPQDCKAAMELYESAAEMGNQLAKVYKGMLLEKGYDDLEPDLARARALYEEVVKETNNQRWCEETTCYAMGRLGRFIEKNAGDDSKQLEEAASWYRKAIAKQKEPTALHHLAAIVAKGYDDVEANIALAVSMLEEATKFGTYAPPYFLLADCVERGYEDVEPNPVKAEELEETGCFIMMNPSIKISKPWQRLRCPALYLG